MLETPLYGKFLGENKKLLFAPTGPYYSLVRGAVFGGFGAALAGFFASFTGAELPIGDTWWLFTGIAFGLAGLLGVYSLESLICDLREGTYRRRQGSGLVLSSTRGKISDFDALVLIAEPNARMMQGGVTYHLVLYWKGQREAPVVVQQETRAMMPGQPLAMGGAYLLQVGMKYAEALGVTFYDNSHFPSKNPVAVLGVHQ